MRTRGFTLVELTVVLVIIGLIMGFLMGSVSGVIEAQRAESTRAKLKVVDAALASFVSVNRRLPCPADGSIALGDAGAGQELGGGGTGNPCTLGGGDQQRGVIPWVALGLAAPDVEDGWGTRFTYRLDFVLARDGGMDMSNCDPAGTGTASSFGTPAVSSCTATAGSPCSQSNLLTCIKPADVLTGKGIAVSDGTLPLVMDPASGTGAAYVVISHGENRGGGYTSSGQLLSAINGVNGDWEDENWASNAFTRGTTVIYDLPQNFSTTNARFDDFVSRPSIMTVAQRAHLGPRSH